MNFHAGQEFRGDCPFHLYTAYDHHGEPLDERWAPGSIDEGYGYRIDGTGQCIVQIEEVLPSQTGADVIVYQRYFLTPDGGELTPLRRRRIGRATSLKGYLGRRKLTAIN